MADLWLTPDEVAELTARIRWTAQCRQLAAMRALSVYGHPLSNSCASVQNRAAARRALPVMTGVTAASGRRG